MVADWVWWLELLAAVLLLAAPTILMLRRTGPRRVPFFGADAVRAPWWAYLFMFPGLVLLNYGSRGLAGGEEGRMAYFGGAAAVCLALSVGLVVRHNRSVASSPAAGGSE